MSCPYYVDCNYCANYYKDNLPESQCNIFGLPIGDGTAYCRHFSCTVDECKRTICITQEELEGF